MTEGAVPNFVLALAPLVMAVGISILYRHTRGKPILFFGVQGASFQQRAASGRSNRNWLTKMGGARNCLVVAVTGRRLVVRPYFPFNLMFLPELYGLECDVPVENILGVRAHRGWSGSALDVEYRDDDGDTRSVSLYLRDPNRFTSALGQAGLSPERQGA